MNVLQISENNIYKGDSMNRRKKAEKRLTLGSDFHLPILEGRVPLRKLLFKPLPP